MEKIANFEQICFGGPSQPGAPKYTRILCTQAPEQNNLGNQVKRDTLPRQV